MFYVPIHYCTNAEFNHFMLLQDIQVFKFKEEYLVPCSDIEGESEETILFVDLIKKFVEWKYSIVLADNILPFGEKSLTKH